MNLNKLPGPMPNSTLAKIILSEHPRGLVKVIVYGKERIGKSMYVIRVMWEIFEALGYDEDAAFDKAFRSLYLKPGNFMNKLEEITEERKKSFENQAVVLCLDDAGIPLGGGLYNYDRPMYWKLKSKWPAIGTLVTGMFLTTPTPFDVAKQFKGWSYRIKIVPRAAGGEYGRSAWVYAEDMDALGIHWYATSEGGFKETFSCYTPDKWYLPYDQRRIKLTEGANRFKKEEEIIDTKYDEIYEKLKESEIEAVFGSPQPLNTNPNTTTIDENGRTSEMQEMRV